MTVEEKLKFIHENVNKFNEENRKERCKSSPAYLLFSKEVMEPFTHALVDARLKHGMSMSDIEAAICATTANMISLLLRSSLPEDNGPIAMFIAAGMADKMYDYLHESIIRNFKNTGEEATNDDTVH